LESGFVLLCGALAVGPSIGYAVFGWVFASALILSALSGECRRAWLSYFRGVPGIWGLVALFALVFLTASWFSPLSSLKDVGELKWIVIWAGLLLPVAALHCPGGAGKLALWTAWFVVAVIVVSSIDGLIQVLTHRNPLREMMGSGVDDFGGRATGMLRNPIPFGHLMGAAFWVAAVGFPFARARGGRAGMWMAAIVAVAGFGGVLMSQARGTWLAFLVVGVASIFLLRGAMRRDWLLCVGVAALFGIGAILFSDSTRERFFSAFDLQENANRYRLEFWQANYSILQDHPWGIGYRVNERLLGEKFDELGFEHHEYMGHSHNEFMEIAVGSGWIGIALYLLLSAWLFVRVIAALRRLDPEVERQRWSLFLLLASALLQVYLHVCAFTDQMSTPGRFLLCMVWAIAIVVPSDLASERGGERGGVRA